MTPDELFLCTLEDLEIKLGGLEWVERADRRQEYGLVAAAALLRKLLLDGDRLVDLVNRARRIKLRYRIQGWPFMSGSSLAGYRVAVRRRGLPAGLPIVTPDASPEVAELLAPRELAREEFLATPVVKWNGVPVTAGGLIRYVANVGGGVHIGRPRKKDLSVEALGNVLVDGYPLALTGLVDIAGTTLKALAPLRAIIEREEQSQLRP
jgi:hypothetical protein